MTELTNAEKRVQVARDVIEQLNAEYLVSKPQTYVGLNWDPGLDEIDVNHNTQIKTILDNQKSCTVCALGACFVSMMRRFNDLTIGGIDEEDVLDSSKGYDFLRSSMRRNPSLLSYLERIFDQDQLLLIEVAYEGINMSGSFDKDWLGEVEWELFIAAHEFHMERATYGSESIYCCEDNEGTELECGDEGSREDDGNAILKDIMKNIIRNKGTFCAVRRKKDDRTN